MTRQERLYPYLIFGLSLVIRLLLVAYGLWQDANKERFNGVKYTDIDYLVFSDAANYILGKGQDQVSEDVFTDRNALPYPTRSPYNRATYRYTPLLAILLTPNTWHRAFGKLMFGGCDLLVGQLLLDAMNHISQSEGVTSNVNLVLVMLTWLWNPIVINISTRGSSESIVALLVLSTISALIHERPMLAGLAWAVSIHFKIYPVIYALPIAIHLCVVPGATMGQSAFTKIATTIKSAFNRQLFGFAFIAGSTLLFLTTIMYIPFGQPFLEQTYLYHLGRQDHRHNFSPYFYPIYLNLQQTGAVVQSMASKNAFFYQLSLTFGIGILALSRSHDQVKRQKRMINVMFLQTMAFVTFNKVVTAQYFMWIISLLPLVLSYRIASATGASSGRGLGWRHLSMLVLWFSLQALWLNSAYQLEHLASPGSFLATWQKSIVWLVGNVVILIGCIIEFGSV